MPSTRPAVRGFERSIIGILKPIGVASRIGGRSSFNFSVQSPNPQPIAGTLVAPGFRAGAARGK